MTSPRGKEMPDINDITTGQLLGGSGALAVLAGAAYRFLRIIKTDRRNDAKDDRIDDWSQKLLARVQELELRVDAMAKERNEALQAAAKMSVEIEYLKDKVFELEKINQELRASNFRLSMQDSKRGDVPA